MSDSGFVREACSRRVICIGWATNSISGKKKYENKTKSYKKNPSGVIVKDRKSTCDFSQIINTNNSPI